MVPIMYRHIIKCFVRPQVYILIFHVLSFMQPPLIPRISCDATIAETSKLYVHSSFYLLLAWLYTTPYINYSKYLGAVEIWRLQYTKTILSTHKTILSLFCEIQKWRLHYKKQVQKMQSSTHCMYVNIMFKRVTQLFTSSACKQNTNATSLQMTILKAF